MMRPPGKSAMRTPRVSAGPGPVACAPGSDWCGARRRRRRAAFTLTEMLVALAVTVVAMAVVSNVFTVTTKTAATSAAIGEVGNLARNWADQLQQDLEYCDPSQSILVIHGRTQAAALTEELRQAGQYYRVMAGDPQLAQTSGFDPRFDSSADPDTNGYSDPRADILMFFTNRPSVSQAPATDTGSLTFFQDKLQRGAKVAPIQVVYGHAALDRAVESGGEWRFASDIDDKRWPRHIETDRPDRDLSPLPANRWHLSRRALLFYEPPGMLQPWTDADYERMMRCYNTDSKRAADAAIFSLSDFLADFTPYVKGKNVVGLARRSPYRFESTAPALGPGHWRWPGAAQDLVNRILYNPYKPREPHHVATVIEHLPAALQSNLGMHLLPGCVWFQVEFLMPEDPRNGLDHPLSDQRRDTPRWVEVEPGQTYVFVPDTDENRQFVESDVVTSGANIGQALLNRRLNTFMWVVPPIAPYNSVDGSVANRRVRMWPYAIRVTVRVIDQRGRLAEPIVRSVVHRFD